MNRDELLIALTTDTRGRTSDGVECIIAKAGYALVPIATIKRLDQLYNTDEVAHDKASEIETCLDELRAAVEA